MRKLSFFIILTIFLCNPMVVLAKSGPIATTDRTPVGDIVIRQQQYQVGSVSVSKPVKVDLIILNIICQNNIKGIEGYAQWLKENVKYIKPKIVP